jgi:hypothetical protein
MFAAAGPLSHTLVCTVSRLAVRVSCHMLGCLGAGGGGQIWCMCMSQKLWVVYPGGHFQGCCVIKDAATIAVRLCYATRQLCLSLGRMLHLLHL